MVISRCLRNLWVLKGLFSCAYISFLLVIERGFTLIINHGYKILTEIFDHCFTMYLVLIELLSAFVSAQTNHLYLILIDMGSENYSTRLIVVVVKSCNASTSHHFNRGRIVVKFWSLTR